MRVARRINFLSGMHRSGGTLISCLLNQHPDIYSTPVSPIAEYMFSMDKIGSTFEASIINNRQDRDSWLVANVIKTYYYDIDKPNIVDRDKMWPSDENIEIIKKYITNKPRIIFPVRPLIEVLASFIKLQPASIFMQMEKSDFNFNTSLTDSDNMCDYLMSDNSYITRTLKFFDKIKNSETSSYFHIVEYNDLVTNTQEVMDGIYDFIKVKKIQNDLENIYDLEPSKPHLVGLSPNLHKVKKNISRSDLKVEDVLTSRSIEKYGSLRFLNERI